jgi:hypothetical protein
MKARFSSALGNINPDLIGSCSFLKAYQKISGISYMAIQEEYHKDGLHSGLSSFLLEVVFTSRIYGQELGIPP